MDPKTRLNLVQSIHQRLIVTVQIVGEVRQCQCGRKAVLVGDLGINGEAQGLFVAQSKNPVTGRSGEPLEASERHRESNTRVTSHRTQQRRRDDRRGDDVTRVLHGGQHRRGQQPADLVAAKNVPPGAVANGRAQTIGVRVVGDHEIGLDFVSAGHGEIECAQLFGVGERQGRERPVRLELRRNRRHLGVTGPGEEFHHGGAANAVERCVSDRQVTVRDGESLRHMGAVLIEEVRGYPSVVRTRALPQCRTCGDVGEALDDLVVGRDYLRAVARVQLVAVVLRGVVARRHHDAGRGIELFHAVGHQRCRQWPGHFVDLDAGP